MTSDFLAFFQITPKVIKFCFKKSGVKLNYAAFLLFDRELLQKSTYKPLLVAALLTLIPSVRK